jgi:uncharacterized protein YprB with RNaseH-like and TPR domain
MALVFDIETIGENFDELDEATKHSLTRWIGREAGDDEDKYNVYLKDIKEGLGFSPLTGSIVAIGIYDTIKKKGVVYFVNNSESAQEMSEGDYTFKPMSEAEMLKSFWQGAKNYSEFISFNGRSFDVPFLMIRSAVHKIKPSINLMANRYLTSQPYNAKHIDLLEQLSFYGAVRRKGSLHLYCRAFGIKSPKEEGITGDDVGRLFRAREYEKIARYNSWDLTATAELYERWGEFIKM